VSREKSVKWRLLETQEVLKTQIFRFRIDKCETGPGKVMPRYYVMEFPDWVQVVALTPERQLILVDQYRYPVDQRFIEFPGGTSDPKTGESLLAAAQRELLEETGYTSSRWQKIGQHYPNPALQTNRCEVFLALDCQKVAPPKLDPFEEINVVLRSLDEFKSELMNGQPAHSLMLATLFLALESLEAKIPLNGG